MTLETEIRSQWKVKRERPSDCNSKSSLERRTERTPTICKKACMLLIIFALKFLTQILYATFQFC